MTTMQKSNISEALEYIIKASNHLEIAEDIEGIKNLNKEIAKIGNALLDLLHGQTFKGIYDSIAKECPIESVKEWKSPYDTIDIVVRCPNDKKFEALSRKYNDLEPSDREGKRILICRRA